MCAHSHYGNGDMPSGVWLGKLLGDMQSVANKSDTTSKLFLYSAVSLLLLEAIANNYKYMYLIVYLLCHFHFVAININNY